MRKRGKFHCRSEAQKRAIKRSYAIRAKQNQSSSSNSIRTENQTADSVRSPSSDNKSVGNYRALFPAKFPFWARLKISKNRTALVIDEEKDDNNKIQFVHREATSQYHKDLEEIKPNPDKDKNEPMYLKRPQKKPIKLFKPHNKNLEMPENLKQRYAENNKNSDDNDGDNNT